VCDFGARRGIHFVRNYESMKKGLTGPMEKEDVPIFTHFQLYFTFAPKKKRYGNK